MPKHRNGPFHKLRQIEVVYNLADGLDSPFVQTFFDGSLSASAQKALKSPHPVNRTTKQPYSPQDLYNLHVKQILAVLGKYKKDGGGVFEHKSRRIWKVTIEVRDRQPRHVG